MEEKKIIWPLAMVALLILGIGVGVYLVKQRQELRIRAKPATILWLKTKESGNNPTPEKIVAQRGDSLFVEVMIDTQENLVSRTELHLGYDPGVLELTKIQPGSFFFQPLELKKDLSVSGFVDYQLEARSAQFKSGQGILAQLLFMVKASASLNQTTEIVILPQSQATILGEEGLNVIARVLPLQVEIIQ